MEKRQEELRNNDILPIFWPPYSPDLNLIEKIWDLIKDYLQENFPERMAFDQLREVMREIWDAIQSSN
jgi:transposase